MSRRDRIEIAFCKALIVVSLVLGAWFVVLIVAFLNASPS